jgi:hypothetical protein
MTCEFGCSPWLGESVIITSGGWEQESLFPLPVQSSSPQHSWLVLQDLPSPPHPPQSPYLHFCESQHSKFDLHISPCELHELGGERRISSLGGVFEVGAPACSSE